jgi:hypothetical protein
MLNFKLLTLQDILPDQHFRNHDILTTFAVYGMSVNNFGHLSITVAVSNRNIVKCVSRNAYLPQRLSDRDVLQIS